jgi:hypothetical protein
MSDILSPRILPISRGGNFEQVLSSEQHLASHAAARRRQQAHHCAGGHGLAAAALADEAVYLAFLYRQVDAAERVHDAAHGHQLDPRGF